MVTAATHDDAARWIQDNLNEPSKKPWTNSISDRSTNGRKPRPREDLSSGRRDRKRATVLGTSDSDNYHVQPRRGGRSYTDRRQVTPHIFLAAHSIDSDVTPFPPRIARRRDYTSHSSEHSSPPTPPPDTTNPAGPPELTLYTITAATIAAVDRHLASLRFYP